MQEVPWVLVIEPDEQHYEIVSEEIHRCGVQESQLVSAGSALELIPAIAQRGSMPLLVLIDWFEAGPSLYSSLETLEEMALLDKTKIIAVAREGARRALSEAFRFRVRRFVAKYPDEISFRRKIADAIRECLGLPMLIETPVLQ